VNNLNLLIDLQQKVDQRLISTHRELKAFVTQLTQPDAQIDNEDSPSAAKLFGDGQGDAMDTDEQRADMNDTENTEDIE